MVGGYLEYRVLSTKINEIINHVRALEEKWMPQPYPPIDKLNALEKRLDDLEKLTEATVERVRHVNIRLEEFTGHLKGEEERWKEVEERARLKKLVPLEKKNLP